MADSNADSKPEDIQVIDDIFIIVRDKLTLLELHNILWSLQANRRVTVQMESPTAIADWHEIELAVIAGHEARVRRRL